MTPLQLRVRQIMHRYREVLHTQGPDVALAGIEGEIATMLEDAIAASHDDLQMLVAEYEAAALESERKVADYEHRLGISDELADDDSTPL